MGDVINIVPLLVRHAGRLAQIVRILPSDGLEYVLGAWDQEHDPKCPIGLAVTAELARRNSDT